MRGAASRPGAGLALPLGHALCSAGPELRHPAVGGGVPRGWVGTGKASRQTGCGQGKKEGKRRERGREKNKRGQGKQGR